VYFSNISDEAIIKDLAYLNHVTLSGTIIVGGDAEEYTNCSKGTYLQMQTVRITGCDGKINTSKNQDINPDWEIYQHPKGNTPTIPLNLTGSQTGEHEVTLNWDESESLTDIKAYYILQNGTVVQQSESNSGVITDLPSGITYKFTVQALCIDGHVSDESNEISITVSIDTSSELTNTKNDIIEIFPNPVSDKVTFQSKEVGIVDMRIMNISGKCIIEKSFTNSVTLEKESIGNSGIYLIELRSGNKMVYDKLIVQ
jgi:hypothetical protein